MAVASVKSSGSGFEVLTEDNYERWSVLMKNNLIGKGLWDTISSDDINQDHQNDKEWERRNAKALYVIQRWAGPDYFKRISEMKFARDAWTLLGLDRGIGYANIHTYAERGDWNKINNIIKQNRDAVFQRNSFGKTALHIAVIGGHEHIVEGLVDVDDQLLTMQDNDGYTALALLVELNDNTRLVRYMIEKNQDLLTIKTNDHQIPLVLASARGHKELTRYLYSQTPEHVLSENNSSQALRLFQNCIFTKIFDVALKLIGLWRSTSMPVVNNRLDRVHGLMPPLLALANMPSIFPSGCPLHWWQRAIYRILTVRDNLGLDPDLDADDFSSMRIISDAEQKEGPEITTTTGRLQQKVSNLSWAKLIMIKEVYDAKSNHFLVDEILANIQLSVRKMNETELYEASAYEARIQAAKYGIVEFIERMSEAEPGLLWAFDENGRGILSQAILNRQEKLKYLFTKAENQNSTIAAQQDEYRNNLLHQAAELGPFSDLERRFGALLQMQREIRWFKEVENFVHPICKEATNDKGKRPHEVFTGSHRGLVKAGEKWAKEAAGSFTIVCTLIITITFAAAFTVPGGNNQNTGFPIFLQRTLFEVFTMADTVSLITSSSSVLISIVILTSRYTEQDFVTRLPLMLLANLFFLFMSVAAMMVAFCTGIAMMLKGYRSLVIAAISLASLPIIVFVPTQLPLFFQIAKSTVGLKGLNSVLLLLRNVFIVILISPFLMSIYLMKKIKWLWDFLRDEQFCCGQILGHNLVAMEV